jgi:hypothetical protein
LSVDVTQMPRIVPSVNIVNAQNDFWESELNQKIGEVVELAWRERYELNIVLLSVRALKMS